MGKSHCIVSYRWAPLPAIDMVCRAATNLSSPGVDLLALWSSRALAKKRSTRLFAECRAL